MKLAIKTPDQLGRQAEAKMAAWKRKKKLEKKKPEPEKVKEKARPISNEQKELNQKFRRAAMNGDVKLVEKLLGEGAELESQTQRGKGTALMIAARGRGHKHVETVKFLLSNGADVNARSSQGGRTVLMEASGAIKENSTMVQLLIDNHAEVNAMDNMSNTALSLCCERKHATIERILRAAGA